MFSSFRQKIIANKVYQQREDIADDYRDEEHFVFKRPLRGPFPGALKKIMFGMGCFWGAERILWNVPGVYMTAVGYSGGSISNPSYKEVCSSNTGHNEVVLVHYDPLQIDLLQILKVFWEGHDPTQLNRQGNDIGSQYRTGIYVFGEDDLSLAENTKNEFERNLVSAGFGAIVTEIKHAKEFFYAEAYHQQYLAKNPAGYCGIGGTGVSFK